MAGAVHRRPDGRAGDVPRPGAARKITDEQVEAPVTRTLTEKEDVEAQHLKLIDTAVPKDLDLHLVLDNYATHKTPAIKDWHVKHPRFHLHFTPTSSNWLNVVERWFAELTSRKLRRSVHRSECGTDAPEPQCGGARSEVFGVTVREHPGNGDDPLAIRRLTLRILPRSGCEGPPRPSAPRRCPRR